MYYYVGLKNSFDFENIVLYIIEFIKLCNHGVGKCRHS